MRRVPADNRKPLLLCLRSSAGFCSRLFVQWQSRAISLSRDRPLVWASVPEIVGHKRIGIRHIAAVPRRKSCRVLGKIFPNRIRRRSRSFFRGEWIHPRFANCSPARLQRQWSARGHWRFAYRFSQVQVVCGSTLRKARVPCGSWEIASGVRVCLLL